MEDIEVSGPAPMTLFDGGGGGGGGGRTPVIEGGVGSSSSGGGAVCAHAETAENDEISGRRTRAETKARGRGEVIDMRRLS
jgi:hypothetical protein